MSNPGWDANDGVLRMIAEYRDEHGYSPTTREIAAALGLAPSTVSGHVHRLARRGLLAVEPRRPRGVSVTGEGEWRLPGGRA